jgi:RNA-binding protein
MNSYNSAYRQRLGPESPQLLKPVRTPSNATARPSSKLPGKSSGQSLGQARVKSVAGKPAGKPAAKSRTPIPGKAATQVPKSATVAAASEGIARAVPTLTPGGKKALRAQAHHLDPVVMIGEAGLSAGVLVEIERALAAHQLIKIRIFGDDRDQRSAILQSITEQFGCAPVQMIGKLLVVWRPAAEKALPRNTKLAGKNRPDRAGTKRLGRSDRKPAGGSPPLRRDPNAPPFRVTKLKRTDNRQSTPATEPLRKDANLEAPLQATDVRDPGSRYVPSRPLPESQKSPAGARSRSSSSSLSTARSPVRPRTPGGKVAGVSLLRKVTRSGH